MAPLRCIDLTPHEKRQLLAIARESIRHSLITGTHLQVDLSRQRGVLTQKHGNFVTLTTNGTLRGCIGSIVTTQHLAQAIAFNAFNAAFNDGRFALLTKAEFDRTSIEISVLSPLEPIDVNSREELLANLRSREDGLLMEDENRHAVFLPKVWEQIPDPRRFLEHLMAKAGQSVDYWSDSLRFHRFHTITFSEETENSELPA